MVVNDLADILAGEHADIRGGAGVFPVEFRDLWGLACTGVGLNCGGQALDDPAVIGGKEGSAGGDGFTFSSMYRRTIPSTCGNRTCAGASQVAWRR